MEMYHFFHHYESQNFYRKIKANLHPIFVSAPLSSNTFYWTLLTVKRFNSLAVTDMIKMKIRICSQVFAISRRRLLRTESLNELMGNVVKKYNLPYRKSDPTRNPKAAFMIMWQQTNLKKVLVVSLVLRSKVFIVPSWEPEMSQNGSTVWKLTLFTVRLWSGNTYSCLERDGRLRLHTTTAPFVAAVARMWSVKCERVFCFKLGFNQKQTIGRS